MKKKLLFILILASIFTGNTVYSQPDPDVFASDYIRKDIRLRELSDEEIAIAEKIRLRSDTFDIVNYRIRLDVSDFTNKRISGRCDIDFAAKMPAMSHIIFDLLEMNVDSVLFRGDQIDFNYVSPYLIVHFDNDLAVSDTLMVSVYYNGTPATDPKGFGGFYFEEGYAFNLGIGLSSNPHNFGRSWFPCFDSFVERSTYDFEIITRADHSAFCTGELIETETLADDRKLFYYRMDQQLPTYLAAVAISNYSSYSYTHKGMEKDIPVLLVARPTEMSAAIESFSDVPFAIDVFEYWFGPYAWSRVGYVLASRGAMEHATLTTYPDWLAAMGRPDENLRLMSHELAHSWWGNITTLSTSHDMWIKEGNAEYSYHLFVDDIYGRDEFLKVLKDNSYDVITNAHTKDDGYRALSGMPQQHTYGHTTYRKGAMIMHNLRSYMGDSLYRTGMQSILKNHAFSHLDAYQFQDELESSTGLDMECFFKNWIHSPGFNAFEIDSVQIRQKEQGFEATIFLEQKLHNAPDFHCDVPLQIRMYFDQNIKIDYEVIVSGQFSEVTIQVPFYPMYWTINEGQKLNNARLGSNYHIKSSTSYALTNEKISINTPAMGPEEHWVRVEHLWVAPDPEEKNKPGEYMRLSNSHYWQITGPLPENNSIRASFFYDGGNPGDLDFDLSYYSEDSIVIVYRPDARHEWQLHPKMVRQKLVPKDGKGYINITGLYPGQYAFANYASTTSLPNESTAELMVYPNPANERLFVSLIEKQNGIDHIAIYTISGEMIRSVASGNENPLELDISELKNGIYMIILSDKTGETLGQGKFIKE